MDRPARDATHPSHSVEADQPDFVAVLCRCLFHNPLLRATHTTQPPPASPLFGLVPQRTPRAAALSSPLFPHRSLLNGDVPHPFGSRSALSFPLPCAPRFWFSPFKHHFYLVLPLRRLCPSLCPLPF